MRGGIDAACEARYNGKTCITQLAGYALRKLDASRGSIPRADDGDRWPLEKLKVAPHSKNWRRIVDHTQARGIRLAKCEIFDTRRVCGPQFGLLARANTQWARRAAAAREVWESGESRAHTSVLADKTMKSTWADIFAANKPQPVEPLVIGSRTIAQRLPPRCHQQGRTTTVLGTIQLEV